MKFILLNIFLLFPLLFFAQINKEEQDSASATYIIVEGDSIPKQAIDLDEVMLLHKLKFNSKEDRTRYLILRRKTIKVYPYAKMAAERLDSMNRHLATLKRNREKKRYTKQVQKYVEGEFSERLKKLTRTEGQILIKLIHRQTGETAFNLVKELRSGWRAFWYNTTANMFDISLKREFDPINVKEDYLIEDILQRNFQKGLLKRQEPALKFDFYELSEKWLD
ncbi:MAG: DUF4294 domain-containing protein [Aestuariibaculum sp.]